MQRRKKYLGHKNYNSIGHLPESRLGSGDHHIESAQAGICTDSPRDQLDLIIVQEKLDGANMGVYKTPEKDGEFELVPLTRGGFKASDSDFIHHNLFCEYAEAFKDNFCAILKDGERVAGEWLAMAHGTRYEIREYRHLFVPFDIIDENNVPLPYFEFVKRIESHFVIPPVLHMGESISVSNALINLTPNGRFGAIDGAEGLVYRVYRKRSKEAPYKLDFMAKYVNPQKEDGYYFSKNHEGRITWNAGEDLLGHKLPEVEEDFGYERTA